MRQTRKTTVSGKRAGGVWIPLLLLLSIAVFLRLYRIYDTIIFRGDQGMDLIVLWHMLNSGHYPLVGPFLSQPGFYTPPTYYYITALFYAVQPTVYAIVTGYFLLNMAMIAIVTKLAWDMGGKRLSLILSGMLAVSATMITQGRQFWNPYPVHLFLAIALLLMWHGFVRRNLTLLWLSNLSWAIALSVYPSPALVFPYMFHQTMSWYRTVQRLTLTRSVLYAFVTMTCTALPVFAPQIIFEWSSGFPTVTSFLVGPPGPKSFDHTVRILGENILALFDDAIPLRAFFPESGVIILVCLLLLFLAVMRHADLPKSVRKFLALPWLCVGVMGFIFYPDSVLPHRISAFLPLLFLIMALVIERALRAPGWSRWASVLILTVFVSINITAYSFTNRTLTDEVSEARTLAEAIAHDVQKRLLGPDSWHIIHRTIPAIQSEYPYDGLRILYFLLENKTIKIPLTPEGNNFDFPIIDPPPASVLYLVCYRIEPERIQDSCIKPVMQQYPRHRITNRQLIGRDTVYILTRADAPQSE